MRTPNWCCAYSSVRNHRFDVRLSRFPLSIAGEMAGWTSRKANNKWLLKAVKNSSGMQAHTDAPHCRLAEKIK